MLYNQEWEKKSSPVADLLNRAADILDQRGHVKGGLINSEGNLCALGSLLKADGRTDTEIVFSGLTPLVEEAVKQIAANLEPQPHGPSYSICSWNNKPETTKETVVNKFREVAAILVAA